METTKVIENYLSQSIRLLHSSAPDSAEKMRHILEQEIIKNCKKSFSKKQIEQMCEAEGAVQTQCEPKKQPPSVETVVISESEEIIEIQTDESQEIIQIQDEVMDENGISAAADLMDLLSCVVCRQIETSANNQLFECVQCQQLYHQLCHPTTIPSDMLFSSWTCFTCSNPREPKAKKKEKERDRKKSGDKKKKRRSSGKSSKRPRESRSQSSKN